MSGQGGTGASGWRGSRSGRARKKTANSINRAIGVLLFVMVVLVGGIVALFLWPTRQTPRSIAGFWAARYVSPRIPTDPTAEADFAAMKAEEVYGATDSLIGESWLKVAAHLKERKPNELVAVYVAGYACIAESGEVMILPADKDPAAKSDRLPLKEILEKIKECKAKEKFVFLDVMRPLLDPTLGFITTDIAGRVQEQVDSVTDPGRLVLMACAPGQVSLSSDLLGRSIFNYYVQEGFRGWADAQGDGIINAREFADFVRTRVEDWASRTRGTSQTPTLLGAPEVDFRLTVVPRTGKKPKLAEDPKLKTALAIEEKPKAESKEEPKKDAAPAQAAPAAIPYPKALKDGFALAKTMREAGALRRAPRPLAELEAALFNAEREWRAGRPEEAVVADYAKLEAAAKRLWDAAVVTRGPKEIPSIALEIAVKGPPKPAVVTAVKDLFDRRAQLTKPDLTDKDLESVLDKDFFKNSKVESHFELSAAVLSALSDPSTRQKNMYLDMIKFADFVLRAHRSASNLAPEARHVETLFLQDVIARCPKLPPNAPPGTPLPAPPWKNDELFAAFDAVRRGERLSAEPEAFPWIASVIDEAALNRHVSLVLFQSVGFVASSLIAEARDASKALDQDLQAYEDALTRARATLDDAYPLLNNLPRYIEASRDTDVAADWREASEAAATLADALMPPPQAPNAWAKPASKELRRAQLEGWNEKSSRLRTSLDALLEPFGGDRFQRLVNAATASGAGASTYVEIAQLLELPTLPVETRESLIDAARKLDRVLHKQHLDVKDFSGASGKPGDREGELKRSRERAERSLALLRLAGVDTAKVEAAVRDFNAKTEPATRNALARELSEAWLNLATRTIPEEKALDRLDRMSRVIPADQTIAVLESLDPGPPTSRLRAVGQAMMWSWTADFYRYLAKENAPSPMVVNASEILDAYTAGGRPVPSVRIELDDSVPPPVLSRQNPTGKVGLRLTLIAPEGSTAVKPDVAVLEPSDSRLKAEAGDLDSLRPNQAVKLSVDIRSDPDASVSDPQSAPPEGILVRAVLNNRPFFLPVKVKAGSAINPPMLLLSAGTPEQATTSLQFRAVPTPQPYGLWVKNPGNDTRKLRVQIFANGGDDPIASSEVTVGPAQTVKVDALTLPPVPAGTPPPAPGAPTGIEITDGLIFRLRDTALPASDPASLLHEFKPTLDLVSPLDLIEVVKPEFRPTNPQDGTPNRLSLTIRSKSGLAAGPAEVGLTLDPALIPGLGNGLGDSVLKQSLKKFGDSVELFAQRLPLDPDTTNVVGSFLVSVDGDPRALKYSVPFQRGGFAPLAATRDETSAFRIIDAKPLAETGKPYRLSVQVDNPADLARLVIGFGRVENGKFLMPDPRDIPARVKSIRLAPDAKGTLAFTASVQDQNVQLDTRGLIGRVQLQVALSGLPPKQTTVFFDGPPSEVKIADIRPADGTTLSVRATAKADCGVKSAKFFLGKPDNRKIPDEKAAVIGTLQDGAYTARLALPKDYQQPVVSVSVQFTNNLDLVEFDSREYKLPEAMSPMNVAAAKLGIVTGKVTHGEIVQAGLTVTIYTPKEVIQTAKTDEKGKYLAKDLPPGEYLIYVITDDKTKEARGQVSVKAGETSVKDLDLTLR